MPPYVRAQERVCFVEIAGSSLFAGVDFGGTKVAAVIADAGGNIAAEGVIPTLSQDGPVQAVERTCRLLDDLCREHSLKILAIGIGLPGVGRSRTLSGWRPSISGWESPTR
jgi:predicted NBD/HSP70 family sugar kinase